MPGDSPVEARYSRRRTWKGAGLGGSARWRVGVRARVSYALARKPRLPPPPATHQNRIRSASDPHQITPPRSTHLVPKVLEKKGHQRRRDAVDVVLPLRPRLREVAQLAHHELERRGAAREDGGVLGDEGVDLVWVFGGWVIGDEGRCEGERCWLLLLNAHLPALNRNRRSVDPPTPATPPTSPQRPHSPTQPQPITARPMDHSAPQSPAAG